MGDPILPSLTLLQAFWDKQDKDFVELLLPFVAAAAPRNAAEPLSTGELQKRLASEAGLDLPAPLLETVIRRGVKRKYFARRENAVYVNPDSDAARIQVRYSAEREEQLRRSRMLVSKLRTFVESELGTEWSDEEAEAKLLNHLTYHGAAILSAMHGREDAAGTKRESGTRYAIGAFVQHVLDTEPELARYLRSAVEGSLLASVIDSPAVTEDGSALQDLVVAVDTEVILDAVGCYGPDTAAARRELVEVLVDAGAEVRVYQQTLDEVHGVLQGAHRELRGQPRPHPFRRRETVAEACVRHRRGPSFLAALDESLPERLAELGMVVADRPDFGECGDADWEKAGAAVRKCVTHRRAEGSDTPTLAEEHDVAMLVYTHLVRGRRAARGSLSDCGGVFMTTNPKMHAAGGEYLRSLGIVRAFPLCESDYRLGTLACLKSRRSLGSLSMFFLNSAAAAALAPPQDLWDDFLRRLEAARDAGELGADEFHSLRCSELTAHEVARQNAEAHASGQDLDLHDALPSIIERCLARQHAEEREKTEREAAGREAAEAKLRARDEGLRGHAQRRARAWSRTLFYALAALFVAPVLVQWAQAELRWEVRAILAAVSLVGVIGNIALGWSGKWLAGRFYDWLWPRMEAGQRRAQGLDGE